MERKIAIGVQNFSEIREGNYFYIDKTSFVKDWWESGDSVTLIARPRRFGKTLNMSMLENFFSIQYANRDDLFDGLSIWQEEEYRKLQGTYPVISLSFANIKEKEYRITSYRIRQLLMKQSLFNSTFKTNPYLERAVMTGITRASKESIFSDLNNLKVVTTTSNEYATAFGFNQEEVIHRKIISF